MRSNCQKNAEKILKWIKSPLHIHNFLISPWWGGWSIWLKTPCTSAVLAQGLCSLNWKMLIYKTSVKTKFKKSEIGFGNLGPSKSLFASVKAWQFKQKMTWIHLPTLLQQLLQILHTSVVTHPPPVCFSKLCRSDVWRPIRHVFSWTRTLLLCQFQQKIEACLRVCYQVLETSKNLF